MIHIVQTGETIYSIAQYYGVSSARLRYDNQLHPSGVLVLGQALLVLIPEITHTVRTGVNPILVLTPFTETGTFNNQLVKIVSEDRNVQQ